MAGGAGDAELEGRGAGEMASRGSPREAGGKRLVVVVVVVVVVYGG
jgi:hypothetical protein